jgi:hypothetical protein
MTNWTRRRVTKGALTIVSTSLLLLNLKPGRVHAQSCLDNYYDPYDCNPDFPCGSGGGGGSGYVCWIDGDVGGC